MTQRNLARVSSAQARRFGAAVVVLSWLAAGCQPVERLSPPTPRAESPATAALASSTEIERVTLYLPGMNASLKIL
jgi:hypothetical protein